MGIGSWYNRYVAKKITPEEVSRFVSLYRSGINTPEIAEITGRSLRAVCYSLKDAGVELRAEQPNKTPRDAEQEVLRMYRGGYLRSEIAKSVGVNESSVGNILRRLGVQPTWGDPQRCAKRAKIWGNPDNQPHRTPEVTENLILSLYRDGAEWDRISEEVGVSLRTVSNVLSRRGVAVSRWFKATPEQRREIMKLHSMGAGASTISAAVDLPEAAVLRFMASGRESAFSNITTPATAYWLGFINADGAILGVNPGTLRLQVALARKDRDHLVKLRDFLGIERNIRDYEAETIGGIRRPYSQLICQDRAVVMDLVKVGVLPNKTGKEKNWVGPDHLMPHYWRGMVDGDGSVPGKSFTVTLAGSYEVIAAFTEWARKVSGTGANPSRDRRSPDHWRAIIAGRSHVPALLSALYGDAPVSLDRKQVIADRILEAAGTGPAV